MTEISSLTDLEARSPKLRCCQGRVLSQDPRLFSMPLPASGQPQMSPGLWQDSSGLCSHFPVSVCVSLFTKRSSLCLFPFLRRIPVILEGGPNLLQYDLLLMHSVSHKPNLKKDHILKYWGCGVLIGFGDTGQARTSSFLSFLVYMSVILVSPSSAFDVPFDTRTSSL